MSETEGSGLCCIPVWKGKSRKDRTRSESRNRSTDRQEVSIRNDPVNHQAADHSVGQQGMASAGSKRSLRDRLLDGAIKFTQFTSVVAGASNLLGPLKAASDILGFVLQTVKVKDRLAYDGG